MNPKVNIASLARGASAPPHVPSPEGALLIAPPRRILTRLVIPALLLASFAGVAFVSLRDSFAGSAVVRVSMPVLIESQTGAAEAPEEAAASSGTPLCQAPGWIEPEPYAVHLSALTPGVVRAVHVLEGDTVGSGTVVAELADEDAHLHLAQAQATLERRNAEYEAARANWQNPITLKEALRTAQAEKTRLEAEKTSAQTALELARKEAELGSSLSREGATGKFSVQKTASAARSAESALAVIQARIEASEAALEAAEQRMKLRIEDRHQLASAEANLHEAQAGVEEARLRLGRCRIESPCSATLMRLYVAPGATLSQDVDNGMRVASLYDPSRLQVRVDVPMADAAKMRPGLLAEIRLEAFGERVFHGTLTRIVHEADIQRNTLQVKVHVADPDPALKPEMIARVQFLAPSSPATQPTKAPGNSAKAQAATGTGTLFIPASLAPAQGEEARLWLVGPDGLAHQRLVRFGSRRHGELRHVRQGLWPSDKLILSSSENLKEGRRVRIAAPASSGE